MQNSILDPNSKDQNEIYNLVYSSNTTLSVSKPDSKKPAALMRPVIVL